LRAVWGDRIRVIQVVEDGNQRLPGTDSAIFIKPRAWEIRSNAAIRSAWPVGKPQPAPARPQGRYAGQVLVPGAPAPHFRRLV
jgi:hypothetical protein